jgi:hypothetical protein
VKRKRPPIAPKPGQPQGPAGRSQPFSRYTCRDYREEMTLLSLQRRLNDPDLPEAERAFLRKEIRRINTEMGME